jgi:hypothetical protein
LKAGEKAIRPSDHVLDFSVGLALDNGSALNTNKKKKKKYSTGDDAQLKLF